MVPNTYFGAGNNSLGMTSSSWQSCAGGYPSCQEPFGACTAVASGGVYDQFTAFRSSTMAKVSPVGSNINCSFLFNDAFSAPYGSYWTTFMSCDYGTGYLAININMNVSVVNMTYGWGACTFAMSHILISHLGCLFTPALSASHHTDSGHHHQMSCMLQTVQDVRCPNCSSTKLYVCHTRPALRLSTS